MNNGLIHETTKHTDKKTIAYIKAIILYLLLHLTFWSAVIVNINAKGIPHSKCVWYYIGENITTDCGYKIVDGCPNCGRNIYINIGEKE